MDWQKNLKDVLSYDSLVHAVAGATVSSELFNISVDVHAN